MFSDFFVIEKESSLRKIFLKIKYMEILINNIKSNREFKRLAIKYKINNFIKKEKNKDRCLIGAYFKGYLVRKNMKLMNKKKENINDIIENNIKEQINSNKIITIELDNKINKDICDLDDEIFYDKKLNDGLESMDNGLKNNLKGCELCCCGLFNVCRYLYYKLFKCLDIK